MKKKRNYSLHWHFGILTSSLYPVHVFPLFFLHIFSICLLWELRRQHYQFHYLLKGLLSKLVNAWFKNSFVRSLNSFLPLSMIAKKCLHKSLVLLKSRREQLQNVSLSPKETLYFNFVSFTSGSSEQDSKYTSIFSPTESIIISFDTLWALSNINVTNDHGLFCKHEGIFSAYGLFQDENLTLSGTYFLYNVGRNLEIMISRSSLEGKGGDHLLFHSTTSTCSRTLRHLFATLHVRWLSHTFNCNVCVYQTATRWDLPPYRITILVIDGWCNICLFSWWIDNRFLLQLFSIGNWWI